jgi:DNA-directed RNA polymerase subunit F
MESDEKEELVSLAEVKKILSDIEKERKELQYEQRIALEHANKFARLSMTKTKQLIKDLNTIDVLEPHHVYKIADILPQTADDVKTIFAKERVSLKDDVINKIIETIRQYYVE